MAESTGARALRPDEEAYVASARATAHFLYAGVGTPHRSCGIALAETYGRATPAYQALRRGGITGKGTCGAIRAGEHVLGELLGDPDPTGAVTPVLREAIAWYQDAVRARRFGGDPAPDLVCDSLVRPHGEFLGPARKQFCTDLAADVSALVAEALCRFAPDLRPSITPPEQISPVIP